MDLHLFDPKSVELAHYASQAYEYADDAKDIAKSLKELTALMDKRYSR